MQTVTSWLKPPKLKDPIATNSARLLYFLLWIMLATIIVTRVVAIALSELVSNTNLVLIVFVPIFLSCHWLLHRGRYQFVTLILIIILSVVAIWLTAITRGILSPYPMTFILPILLGGVIFDRRIASLFTLSCCVFVTYQLVVGLSNISFSDELATNMISNWLVFVTIYLMSTFLVIYTQGVIRRTLTQLTEQNRILESEISKRKQIELELRSSEELFRTLTENSVSGIYMMKNDDSRNFVYVNRKMEEIFGYTASELLSGMRSYDLIHPDEHSKLEQRMLEHSYGKSQLPTMQYRVVCKDGSEKQVLTVSIPITYQDEQVLIGTAVDVTAEHEALQSRIDLEAKQQQIMFLRDFIGTMTHDLKTPLSVINTSVYLVQKAKDEERRENQLNKISSQVKRLAEIIDDILTIVRLDTRPSLQLEVTDLNELILQVTDQLKTRFEAKDLQVTYNLAKDLPFIHADQAELIRALTNLIENAVNYTPVGQTITLRSIHKENEVILFIQDSGIGIPPQDLPDIFRRFRRASNANSISEGTGLGLAIVDQIVKLHGANIDVSSEIGEGTEFRLQFEALHL